MACFIIRDCDGFGAIFYLNLVEKTEVSGCKCMLGYLGGNEYEVV